MRHKPGDPILGADQHRAFLAEFQFLMLLKQLANCNGRPPEFNYAYNFILFVCFTYKIPDEQRDNIMNLTKSLYRFIDIDLVFNRQEIIMGLKHMGYKNIKIAEILGISSRSMINYYIDKVQERNLRSHVKTWGQLTDIETYLNCHKKFTEALNG